jgi:hypothetical protein
MSRVFEPIERNDGDEKKHLRCKMMGENILCRFSMCLHGSGLIGTYYIYVHMYMHIHRRRETLEARKRDARKHAVRCTWRMRKREAATKVDCVLNVQNVFSIAFKIVLKHAVGCIWRMRKREAAVKRCVCACVCGGGCVCCVCCVYRIRRSGGLMCARLAAMYNGSTFNKGSSRFFFLRACFAFRKLGGSFHGNPIPFCYNTVARF